MTKRSDQDAIRKEVEAVLRSHGIRLPAIRDTNLTDEQFQRLRELAVGVLRGSIPTDEISKLPSVLSEQLDTMIRNIISLKGNATLREIQERNPYYNVFSSPIVRDDMGEGQ